MTPSGSTGAVRRLNFNGLWGISSLFQSRGKQKNKKKQKWHTAKTKCQTELDVDVRCARRCISPPETCCVLLHLPSVLRHYSGPQGVQQSRRTLQIGHLGALSLALE